MHIYYFQLQFSNSNPHLHPPNNKLSYPSLSLISSSLSFSPFSNGSNFNPLFIPLPVPPQQMSSTAIIITPPPPPSPYPSPTNYIANIGLGYSIAIALGFLIFLSSILLAFYICCRTSRRRRHQHPIIPSSTGDVGIMLPRNMFVAENDDREESVLVGLDQSVINSYPKFRYSRDAAAVTEEGGCETTTTCCSICLCEYKEAEMLRMMPECRHYFHLSCLDVWLKLNGSCPVCRNSPLPTPVSTPISTPLSEIVPLSLYAADRRRSR